MKISIVVCLILLALAVHSFLHAEELPVPLRCYQQNTQAEDIEGYMSCFTDDAVMIDVGRTITGKKAIRSWAQREVIPNGDTFEVKQVLDFSPGYYKTSVQWMSWVVHYHFWYDERGRIRKMSLQYSDTGLTEQQDVYDQLPAAVKLYFDAVKAKSSGMIEECFMQDSSVTVVTRSFNGRDSILGFAQSEVFGGAYKLKAIQTIKENNVVVLLSFTPKGWSSPEPDAVYDIQLRDGRITHMNLQYAD